MPGFEQIEWFPLCAGLTALGLVATWFAWRRRGAASGLRLAAWSLLPLAAYLTGIITVLWETGKAVASWAVSLVVSPSMWAGVALAGLAMVAFVVSGVMRKRASQRPAAQRQTKGAAPGKALEGHGKGTGSGQETAAASQRTAPASSGASAGTRAKASAGAQSSSEDTGDDDFSDVEEILRRRGIS